jgi:hypothetical protein
MKHLKHEAELFKAALLAGVAYAEERKAAEFEATDSASAKALYVYRLLIHDRLWYARQLPAGHPLLK